MTKMQGIRVVLSDGSKWIVPFTVESDPEFGLDFETRIAPHAIDAILFEDEGATAEVVTMPYNSYYDGAGTVEADVDAGARIFGRGYTGMPELTDV